MDTTQELWWEMVAYNTESLYGYGTEDEAREWAKHLNRGKEINLFSPEPLDDEKAIDDLNDGKRNDGVNLADELAEIASGLDGDEPDSDDADRF